MNIHIGNLSADTSEDDLRKAFEPFGRITSITIIKDKFSGNPLGFGFVEMPGNKQAQQAVEALNRTRIKGRVVMVSATKPRIERRNAAAKSKG
ncbi:MAG: RNA recognition motif domain-containing protein [Planctomycetota bacterium]|jgi:RNA recognition motif-containing protein